jgi:hypothetical protein
LGIWDRCCLPIQKNQRVNPLPLGGRWLLHGEWVSMWVGDEWVMSEWWVSDDWVSEWWLSEWVSEWWLSDEWVSEWVSEGVARWQCGCQTLLQVKLHHHSLAHKFTYSFIFKVTKPH